MSKALRLSEKWFRFGLWLVAVVFASFLIGLGNNLVANLPKVEHYPQLEDYIDPSAAQKARQQIRQAEETARTAQEAHDQAQLKLNAARANAATARDTFNGWLSTRHATQRPDQDAELIARTRALEELKVLERKALSDVERVQQVLLDARQAEAQARRNLQTLENDASGALSAALQAQELRVFGYRLALTLPLLGIAGWLFAKKRQSTWWPFVWGFIYFALFAFFVELVPYLPSSPTTRRWPVWAKKSARAASARWISRTRASITARIAGFACSTTAAPARPARAPSPVSVMPAAPLRRMRCRAEQQLGLL